MLETLAMAMPIISSGAKAASSLAGLFDGDGAVGARERGQDAAITQMAYDDHTRWHDYVYANKTMKDQMTNQFNWLVEGAQKAGFNPLTALGKSTHVPMASSGVGLPLDMTPRRDTRVSEALAGLAEAADEWDPIDRERRKLENELLEKRIAQVGSENQRLGVQPVRKTSSKVEVTPYNEGRDPRPKPRLNDPEGENRRRIPVWVNGQVAMMDASIARQNNIVADDIVTTGTIAEIVGEVQGETHALAFADKNWRQAFQLGLLKNPEDFAKERKTKKDREDYRGNTHPDQESLEGL